MMQRIASALCALTLMVGGARAQAAPPPDLSGQVEASMKRAEALATETSFPKANAIAEVANAIRDVVYARDLTPSAMVSVLDEVAASGPLSEIASTAVKQVRDEIIYAG